VLFLGGLRDAEVLLAEFDAVGLGVEDILMAESSCDISDMLLSGVTGVMTFFLSRRYFSSYSSSLQCIE
jgi:hypothetical protein